MEKKNWLRALAILFAIIIVVSSITPCIAVNSSSNAPYFYNFEQYGTSERQITKVNADISSDSKAKSILQIENVKSDLTDAQKKLSTDILQLIDSNFLPPGQNRETLEMRMKRLGQYRPASSVSPKADGRVAGDLVYVYVYLKPPAETQTIEPYVWEVTDRDEENHLSVAWVEVKDMETLASLDEVRTIRTVMPPLMRTGSVTTEGDAIHRTYDVRTTYSQDGSGVKIGIISDGVDHWTDAQTSGDLPASLTVLSNTQGGDEGTAMLEIVHDMVPGAELYFHDRGDNVVAFNAAIDALVNAGCDVVCDDIGWFLEPFFEDGIVASHVKSVLASNDIVYASSAGNAGNKHYQGDYYNDGHDFHDFSRGSDDYLYVNIPNNGEVTVVLQWNDKFGASGNNYDLYLFNTDGWDVLARSIYPQNGDDDPLEAFSYTNTGGSTIVAEIDVGNYNGAAATKTLEVFIYPGNGVGVYANNIDPTDSIFGHPAVPEAIAVGAIDANDPGNDNIEPFSSQGPVTITYPSQVSRPKPDLCGVDGVTVTGAGGFPVPFYGTSAAAPHIAAIAAQLWGANRSKTGDEIRTRLYSTAVDLGSAGYDNVFGYGRANATYENQPPSLSNGYVTPSTGNTTTNFNYNVTYTDSDGDAPTIKYVYIDGSPYTMTEIRGDYTSGATFEFSTTLPNGTHNYSFDFNDGHGHTVRLPASGAYPGPIRVQAATTVSIEDVTLNQSTSKDVPIRLLNSTGVCSASVTLMFDPAIANLTNAVAGDFDSVFNVDYTELCNGTVLITVNKSGEDLTGDLTFATVTLHAVGSNGSSCELGLSAELSTKAGASVQAGVDNGTFTISDGRTPGDVNGDTKVNVQDAVLLFNWVSFPSERGTTYVLAKPENANVNGDTAVNISDAVLLFNWVSFPSERGTTYILQ